MNTDTSRHDDGTTYPRRSGLHGPTAILLRSDIFKSHWHTEDVGPEGADLHGTVVLAKPFGRWLKQRGWSL
jgi:hypothetical protein